LNTLLKAGVDVFRLNFSHGDHPGKSLIIERIRNLSRRHKRAVAILGDLQGPQIRTGLMKNGAMELCHSLPGCSPTLGSLCRSTFYSG
jgi:pyruvate kinase